MKDFLLTDLLSEGKDTTEVIIKILQARGFLIDSFNGRYYLSDNATVDDAEYLDFGLNEYNIGHVVNKNEYVEKRRRNWYKYALSPTYTYKALQPFKVEIIISKSADVDSAISFFTSIERVGEDCSSFERGWSQFAIESLGPKANVRELEAYVSYYVKAISACGVYTCRSCDGNHSDGGSIYVDSEYPSDNWHRFIWSKIIQPRFGAIPFIGDRIRFTRKTQEEIYSTVYQIANFLYQNRLHVLYLKKQTLENLNSRYIKHHSSAEIEAFYIEECNRVMQVEKEY